jgi:hypothetical protein
VAAPGEAPRRFAALLNATTGAVDPTWRPDPGHDVHDIVRDGTTVWLGGSFACLQDPDVSCATLDAGQDNRRGIAAVSATDGDALPSFTSGVAGGYVSDIDLSAGALTIVGSFGCASPSAALDADCADAADAARGGAARLTTSGAIAGWNPAAAGGTVHGVARLGDAVWLAGSFTTLKGASRLGLGAVDYATGYLLPADPRPNLPVDAVTAVGGRVLAGGSFTGFGGLTRRGLAAIDLQTGEPTPFAPDAQGRVDAIDLQGSTLYVAGPFGSLAGTPRDRAGAIDVATGTATGFAPQPAGTVRAIDAAGDVVVLGGSFGGVAGDADQHGLAAVRADTGAAVPDFPAIGSGSQVNAVRVLDGVVYAGGDFGALGGVVRQRAGAVALAARTVTPWQPAVAGGEILALADTPGGIAVGGTFSGLLAVVDRTSGAPRPGFAQGLTGDGDVRALSSDGRHLAVGGLALLPGDGDHGITLLDARTGAPAGWSPARSGAGALLLRDGALAVGSWRSRYAGIAQGHFLTLTPAAANLEAPSVTGAVAGGSTVTCAPGRWDGNPLLTRAWLVDGKVVAGATGETFQLPAPGDAPVQVSCRVTGRSIRGSATADAAPVVLPAIGAATPAPAPASGAVTGGTPSGSASADRTAPVLSALRATGKRRLRATWSLSEAARVTVRVDRRKGTRWSRAGAVTVRAPAGRHALRLPARLGRRALAPGRYRLRVTAVDAAGNRSAERRAAVRLRRR